MTLPEMLQKFVQDPNKSPPMAKSQVQEIVRDIARGLLHMHNQGFVYIEPGYVYSNLYLSDVYLYKEAGKDHLMAKLSDLRGIKRKVADNELETGDNVRFETEFWTPLLVRFTARQRSIRTRKRHVNSPITLIPGW